MGESFTDEEKAVLEKYVTSVDKNVFCVLNLNGIAGCIFARYSRASTGFKRTLLKEFLDEQGNVKVGKAEDLIERVLIAFGDDSVGELEGTHLSLEQISNIATKVVEDVRIGGSPIEQSTRYVFYDQQDENGKWKYYREPKIMADKELAVAYESTLNWIFETYAGLVSATMDYLSSTMPAEAFEVDLKGTGTKIKLADLTDEQDIKDFNRTYKMALRAKACDAIRVVLPAATLTNVGIYGNGRYYHALLDRLYSNQLGEMPALATSAKQELDKVIPKFVKRAKANEYNLSVEKKMQQLTDVLFADVVPANSDRSHVSLADSVVDETNYIAAILYRFCEHPLYQIRQVVRVMTPEQRTEIIQAYTSCRKSRRDRSGRALEYGYPLTYDLVGDFGIYRDLQRHRMLTQERQRLSPNNGYWLPELLVAAGLASKVKTCFEKSTELYRKIRNKLGKDVAQYAVLFGHNIRWTMGMNPREAQHMFELRTGPQGHPNYRKACQEMATLALERYPFMKPALDFVDYKDYSLARAESEAKQRRDERKIDTTVS